MTHEQTEFDYDNVKVAENIIKALMSHKCRQLIKSVENGTAIFLPQVKGLAPIRNPYSLDQSHRVQLLKQLTKLNIVIRKDIKGGRKRTSYTINYNMMAKIEGFLKNLNSLENDKKELSELPPNLPPVRA
jgi:hypothetical protein